MAEDDREAKDLKNRNKIKLLKLNSCLLKIFELLDIKVNLNKTVSLEHLIQIVSLHLSAFKYTIDFDEKESDNILNYINRFLSESNSIFLLTKLYSQEEITLLCFYFLHEFDFFNNIILNISELVRKNSYITFSTLNENNISEKCLYQPNKNINFKYLLFLYRDIKKQSDYFLDLLFKFYQLKQIQEHPIK